MIKAVFFDFDGVIVESVGIKTDAFARLFEAEGKKAVNEIVSYHLNHTGVSRYDKFRCIYKEILKRRLADDEFQGLCDRFACLVVDEVVRAPYVKGAREFLENSSGRYLCYVLSATPREEIGEIIEKRGISKYFKKIYGAPFKKTDAVKEVLIKEKIDPFCAVYIGDALSDYLAAKDNSVSFIARICENGKIFENISCDKVRDLKGLDTLIGKL